MAGSKVAHRQTHCWKSSTVPYPDLQGAGREWHWAWVEQLKLKSPFPVTDFLQQTHTYSSKATSPNPCQAVPFSRDQTFEYMSLWRGLSYSNHYNVSSAHNCKGQCSPHFPFCLRWSLLSTLCALALSLDLSNSLCLCLIPATCPLCDWRLALSHLAACMSSENSNSCPHTCLVYYFALCCCYKYPCPKPTKGKNGSFYLSAYSPPLGEVKEGIQGRNLEAKK